MSTPIYVQYRSREGRLAHITMRLPAGISLAHLSEYRRCFGVTATPERVSANACNVYNLAGAAENIERAVRCGWFAKITGLLPTSCFYKGRALIDKVPYPDHLSEWRSLDGTVFIMNEPYWPSVEQALASTLAAGLEAIVVPTELAVYQGGACQGCPPRTYSLLICKASDATALQRIKAQLVAAQGEQAWLR